ncbi:HAD family hydrolase [soil metagenome]
MNYGQPHEPVPIAAVLFDFHQTLVQTRDVGGWLAEARTRLGRVPEIPGDEARMASLSDIWSHAQTVDPTGLRDLSVAEHRRVSVETMTRFGGFDAALAAMLYDTLPRQWRCFDDAPGVLRTLHEHGIRLAVVSNIGIDIRPCLEQEGVLELFDAIALSYEVGTTKPDQAIFDHAITALDVGPEATLMVGDSWRDDAGAAALGIRCLILPPTSGSRHGLEAVLRLAGVDREV